MGLWRSPLCREHESYIHTYIPTSICSERHFGAVLKPVGAFINDFPPNEMHNKLNC